MRILNYGFKRKQRQSKLNSKLKSVIKWLLISIFIFGSFYYVFKDIDFVKLQEYLISADYFFVLLPVPIILFSHWVRAYRWKTMLNPIVKVNSIWNLFSSVMIGYAVNTVVPRGGEFVRPYVTSKKEKISYSSTFATIILERVIDVVTLVIIFGITFALLSDKIVKILPDNINPNQLIIITTLIVLIILLNLYPPFVDFMLRMTVKPFSVKLYEKLLGIVDRFKKGLAIVKEPSMYLKLILESFSIWFLYSLPLYILFFAFDFQSQLHLNLVDATMLVIVAGISVTISPTPNGAGVYQIFVPQAMVKLYGMNPEIALAYSILAWATSTFTQFIVGMIFFYKEGLKSFTIDRSIETANGEA